MIIINNRKDADVHILKDGTILDVPTVDGDYYTKQETDELIDSKLENYPTNEEMIEYVDNHTPEISYPHHIYSIGRGNEFSVEEAYNYFNNGEMVVIYFTDLNQAGTVTDVSNNGHIRLNGFVGDETGDAKPLRFECDGVAYHTWKIAFYESIERLTEVVNNKQELLISGENIKTINGQNILGEGDIEIQGGGGASAPYVIDATKDLEWDDLIAAREHFLNGGKVYAIVENNLENTTSGNAKYCEIIWFTDANDNNQFALWEYCGGFYNNGVGDDIYVISIYYYNQTPNKLNVRKIKMLEYLQPIYFKEVTSMQSFGMSYSDVKDITDTVNNVIPCYISFKDYDNKNTVISPIITKYVDDNPNSTTHERRLYAYKEDKLYKWVWDGKSTSPYYVTPTVVELGGGGASIITKGEIGEQFTVSDLNTLYSTNMKAGKLPIIEYNHNTVYMTGVPVFTQNEWENTDNIHYSMSINNSEYTMVWDWDSTMDIATQIVPKVFSFKYLLKEGEIYNKDIKEIVDALQHGIDVKISLDSMNWLNVMNFYENPNNGNRTIGFRAEGGQNGDSKSGFMFAVDTWPGETEVDDNVPNYTYGNFSFDSLSYRTLFTETGILNTNEVMNAYNLVDYYLPRVLVRWNQDDTAPIKKNMSGVLTVTQEGDVYTASTVVGTELYTWSTADAVDGFVTPVIVQLT